MRKSVKLCLTALTAAFLLSSAVGTASARTFVTSEPSFRAIWSSLELAAPGVVTIRCRVTLEGSFHSRTIAKVERSLIGAISRAIVAHPCTNGEAWADNGTERASLGTLANRLPFHVTYEGFIGRLPNITGIRLLLSRLSFVIQTDNICTGRYGNATDNITGEATREAGGAITTLSPIAGRATATLVTRLAGILCPGSGQFNGTGEVFSLSAGTRIRITLI